MGRKILLLIAALFLFGTSNACAGTSTYEFTPNPADLQDLDHSYYYGWLVTTNGGLNPLKYQDITSAVISIENLNDWVVETTDILYIDLLNDLSTMPGGSTNISANVKRWYDGQGGGDAFFGKGQALTTYSDDDTGANPSEDWTYTFTANQLSYLKNYISNGNNFALGFDPDCHFYNDGIKLTITTATTTIPEPGSLSLLGLGLVGLLRKKR